MPPEQVLNAELSPSRSGMRQIDFNRIYAELDKILERKESSKFLFNAIEKLNFDQKTAYILKNNQGMPYRKISKIMEKSVSSIESLIFRAKKNLKTELEKKLNSKK